MAFQSHMNDQTLKACNKAHMLVLDILRHITVTSESVDTLRLDESDEQHMSNEVNANSTGNSNMLCMDEAQEHDNQEGIFYICLLILIFFFYFLCVICIYPVN